MQVLKVGKLDSDLLKNAVIYSFESDNDNSMLGDIVNTFLYVLYSSATPRTLPQQKTLSSARSLIGLYALL